jgi:pantothenate kinase
LNFHLDKEAEQVFYNLQELSKAVLVAMSNNPDSRFILALVGAPGSGKSTVAGQLIDIIEKERPGLNPVVVPMDGFHLDNLVLDRLGLRARKGSPPTFDAFGYINTLSRIHEDRELVWVPLFDRSMDLARAGAIEVSRHNRLVITEGNYLLLAEDPWQQVGELVDKTVLVDVGLQTLAERLMQRWLDHGFNDEEARSKVEDNDLDNARYILNKSMTPDWRLVNE